MLVSTFEAVRRRGLRWVTHVVNADLPLKADAYRPASVVLEKIVTLGSRGPIPAATGEAQRETRKDFQLPDDDQVVAGAIGEILRQVRSEDPAELARYLRLLRRHAPLTQRSSVAGLPVEKGLRALAAPASREAPRRGRSAGAAARRQGSGAA